MGDYGRAEPLYQKALEIFGEALGEKHPTTAAIYNNLGLLYLAKGEVASACEIFSKPNNPEGLGACHLARGEHDKARAEFERALKHSEERGEKEFIIGDNIGLGLAHEGLGNYPEAPKHFLRAIEIMESQRTELAASSRESFLSGKVGVGFSRLDAYEGMIRVYIAGKAKRV
jgi:tetratricopeptide (TPR) repeat protein